jgi:hypothetical protein
MNELAVVQQVCNYADVLRDEGAPDQAYMSQIFRLLFFKMDEERAALVASGLITAEGSALPGIELTRNAAGIEDLCCA